MNLYDSILTYIQLVIIIIGLVGNLLSFIIFSRSAFKKNSISIYCRALAVFDCFLLSQLAVDIGLLFFNSFFWGMQTNETCKIFYFIGFAISAIPGWILIAFSLDKLLSMKKTASFLKKRSIQYIIVLGIILYNCLLYIEVPIYLSLSKITIMPGVTISSCTTSTLSFSTALQIINLLNNNLVPFIIMLAASVVMIKLIRDSSKVVVERSSAAMVSTRRSRDFKFALSSLTFNFMFITLKLPIAVIYIFGFYNNSVSDYVFQIAVLLYFINYSNSFFVHMISNSIFRREFFIFIRLRKPNSVDSVHSTAIFTNRKLQVSVTATGAVKSHNEKH